MENVLFPCSDSATFLFPKNATRQREKALKRLRQLIKLRGRRKSADAAAGHQAAALLAGELLRRYAEGRRNSTDASDGLAAELNAVLAPYSDFSVISNFSYDFDDPLKYRNPKAECFLLLAHWRAIRPRDKDIPSAMKALSFAEGRTKGLDKCLALFEFADTLHDIFKATDDIDSLERAGLLLDECEKYGAEFFRPVSESQHGPAREKLGTKEWRRLRERIFHLRLNIEIAGLAREFGPDYALYVKMRTCFDEKRWLDAFVAAERLAFGEDGWRPEAKNGKSTKKGGNAARSVCAEAGRLYWCKLLLMNDAAGEYRSASLPSGVEETKRFISDKPKGLYRGDALMELARFNLEKKWNWKKAAFYYEKALKWFRTARGERDAVDLYALPPKLASFAAPYTPRTTLDAWRRTIRRKIDPKEIVNRRTAPWHVTENEKECLFMTGFLMLEAGKAEKALKRFSQVSSIDKNIAFLERKNFPNALMRLRSCCKTGYIVLPPKCRKLLSRENKNKLFLAEFRYVLEDFAAAERIYRGILADPKSKVNDKAAAMMGIGNCHDMMEGKTDSAEWFAKAYEAAPKTAIGAESLYRLACNLRGNGKPDEAIKRFKTYLKKFPRGARARSCLFNLAQTCHGFGRRKEFELAAKTFLKRYPKSDLNKYLRQMEKQGPDEMLAPEE